MNSSAYLSKIEALHNPITARQRRDNELTRIADALERIEHILSCRGKGVDFSDYLHDRVDLNR